VTAGPTERLAHFAAGLKFADLPRTAVTTIERMVLDCLGTTLAGVTLGSGMGPLLALVEESGGRPEATIIGAGARTAAHLAALANGGAAHALNYDDYLPAGGVHLGVTSVPAALAAAEHRGGVGGPELIAALAAGNEVTARLGAAIQAASGSYTETRPQISQMLGYFNAAACAGCVLGLDEDQMLSALGLAFMQASGGRQPVVEGTEAKALYAAFPNQGGVTSALLARRGLGAACRAFEGEAGLFATYFHGKWDPAALEDGLGQTYRFEEVTFKPWPTTNLAHVFIEAAISLAREHDIQPADVAGVHLRGQPHIRTFCEPAASRQAPRTSVEAEDSIPFAVAKALVNRKVTLDDLQPAGLTQPAALHLAAKVSYSMDERIKTAGVVNVATTAGQHLEARIERPLGYPPRTMSERQLVDKFLDCAGYAARRASPEKIVDLALDLHELDDTGRLMALLS
jgi:2-methylcitrate dehydratase PrpD